MENRLAIKLYSNCQRHAIESIGEMLFPAEDVATLRARRFIGINVT